MNNKIKIIIFVLSLFLVLSMATNIIQKKQIWGLEDEVKEQINLSKYFQEEIERLNKMNLIEFQPTYKDIIKILSEDKTNEIPYVENDFNCIEFSFGLVKSLLERGIYSCITFIGFESNESHTLTAINTLDEGIIYVEPQTDRILFNLNVGEDYCEKIDWDCEWEIVEIKSCFSGIENNLK